MWLCSFWISYGSNMLHFTAYLSTQDDKIPICNAVSNLYLTFLPPVQDNPKSVCQTTVAIKKTEEKKKITKENESTNSKNLTVLFITVLALQDVFCDDVASAVSAACLKKTKQSTICNI